MRPPPTAASATLDDFEISSPNIASDHGAVKQRRSIGITCHDAELAISRQLDGRLSRKEKSGLRAHLRECDDCARFARSQRAQRGAIKSLALIPLPSSLTSFFGHGGSTAAATGGGAALGGGLAVKAAALGAGALVATGVGYEGVKQIRHGSSPPNRVAASASTQGAPAARAFVATAEPIARDTDLKPSRARSVHARRGHHGRPAVGRAHRRHKEVSPLPPSRGRAHDQKPVNPGRPASPGKSNQHRHQGRVIHQKPKPPPPPRHQKPPPPPPPPPHGNGGGNGHGTDTPPPTGHGNAH